MKTITLFAALLIFSACSSGNEHETDKQETDSTITSTIEDVGMDFAPLDLDKAEAVVTEFYDWYLHDIIGKGIHNPQHAEVVKINDSTYTLDLDGQIAALKNAGYFSDDFIANLKRETEICMGSIENVVFVNEQTGEYGLYGLTDAPGCENMYEDNWIGDEHMDTPDEFSVVSATQEEEKVNVEVKLHNGPRTQVLVGDYNGEYKIFAITLEGAWD